MTASLYVSDQGNGPQTIVFLHGFGGCSAIWRDQANSLSQNGRSLAYDLPGHDQSLDFPDAGPPKLAARSILADLAQRGVGKVHIVGHSMGGAIAVIMALSQPENISSLTLLAPGGFGPQINGPLLRRYGAASDFAELRACLEAMSGPGSTVPEATVKRYVEMRARPGQKEKLVEIAEIITKNDRQGEIPRTSLAALTMPVSVVWGTNDPVLPPTQADDLPQHFQRHLVAGAGHMLIEEAPDLFKDLIDARINASQT